MTRPAPDPADRGVATVEFALLLGVMLLLVAFTWPLGNAFVQKMRLDRTMSDVVRYATATPNTAEFDPTDPEAGRRPTCAQVADEFYRAYGVTGEARSDFTITIPSCPNTLDAGQPVSITVAQTTTLGPLGDLLSIAGITHSSTITVTAGASGREE